MLSGPMALCFEQDLHASAVAVDQRRRKSIGLPQLVLQDGGRGYGIGIQRGQRRVGHPRSDQTQLKPREISSCGEPVGLTEDSGTAHRNDSATGLQDCIARLIIPSGHRDVGPNDAQ